MPASQLAVQLYTLRDFCKTPEDIARSLQKVKEIGYDAVQVSGIGKIDPKELAALLKNIGLQNVVTHIPIDRMESETGAVVEEHKLWNCKYTAIGGFFPKDPTWEDWLSFADRYNAVAKKFQGSGIAIGYHNHSHEFVKYDDQTPLGMLVEKLDKSIWFEIDTYWVAHGGGDPVQWIDKVKGRIPCIHLKDMGIRNDRTQYMAEVGEGNLNWDGILQACKAAGVEWYIVEQDDCNGRDPFESLAISYKNLKKMGMS